jgi:hypothetical protein
MEVNVIVRCGVGITFLVASLGCTSPSAPRSSDIRAPSTPQPTVGASRPVLGTHAPLEAKWIVRNTENGRTSLTAHVDVFSPILAPPHVKLLVPEGVVVSGGDMAFDIPAPNAPTTVERDYTVSFKSAPPKDLLLVVDVQTPRFGLHAEDAYRFGRPPPLQPAPKATGPHLKIGNVDLGASIPIGQR